MVRITQKLRCQGDVDSFRLKTEEFRVDTTVLVAFDSRLRFVDVFLDLLR